MARLGNIQVANAYNDGQWAYKRNLLRRNDRELALMCWDLMAARERDGLGRIEAKHQKGHAERRKKRTEFDIHEIYNGKVDSATHTAHGPRQHHSLRLFRSTLNRQDGGMVRTARDR